MSRTEKNKLCPLRTELAKIISETETCRPPAVRRSSKKEWLYATDLPQIADCRGTADFIRRAGAAGWYAKQESGWIYLDRNSYKYAPAEIIPTVSGSERACLKSMIERHKKDRVPSDGEAERMLIKAGEKGPDAYESACRHLHRKWAERLRNHRGIPDMDRKWFEEGKELC